MHTPSALVLAPSAFVLAPSALVLAPSSLVPAEDFNIDIDYDCSEAAV